jgi:putative ATPase
MGQQTSLFEAQVNDKFPEKQSGNFLPPYSHLMRPVEMKEFAGIDALIKKYPHLNWANHHNLRSLVLTGPSGAGKTTLARLLATSYKADFYKFNAVLGGVNDLKKLIESALKIKHQTGTEAVIFIDEIHRFNKAQQDALLPYIEEGDFVLIGATTEVPKIVLNKALLSRLQIIYLNPISESDISSILAKAVLRFELSVSSEILKTIAHFSNGDARIALNSLEEISKINNPTIEDVKTLIIENSRAFDKDGNRHYDVISAFIKSMRGSDPNAAILWLAVMIDGGEDPKFIARRLVIFASEDIGNADPTALTLATSALMAVDNIGMPEARIILAQATTYLASTYKSNSSYLAINEALSFVQNHPTIKVPDFLKSSPPPYAEKKYLYPHNYENHHVKQSYTEEKIPDFYRPTKEGKEDGIKKRLENLKV